MHSLDKVKHILNTIARISLLSILFFAVSIFGPFTKSVAAFGEAKEPPTGLSEGVLSQYAVGIFLMESGETHRAVEFFEAAWEESYYHPTIGTRLAEAYYALKKFSKSEAIVNNVLSQSENDYTALLLKAKIRYLQGDSKGAVEYLEKIASIHGASFEIHRLLGNIYYEADEKRKALDAYESALRINPNSSYMQHRYGLLLVTVGRLDDAEKAFRKSISLNPQMTESAVELAGILFNRGQMNEAESVLIGIVQRGIRFQRALLMLATLYLEMGRLDEGIQLLEQQKKLAELPRDVNVILGRMYFEAKEYDEAEAIYKKLFEKEKNNSELAKILGDTTLRSGKTKQALKYYRKAIEIDPNDYRKYLGLFFATSSKFAPQEVVRIELSEAEVVGLLKKAGDLVGVENFNGNYLVGICYLSIDSLESARGYLSTALDLSPDDEGTLLNLATIAERTGRFEEAEGYLENLYKIKPDDPTINNFYGYILAEMGKNLTFAEKLVRKALEKDPSNGYYIDSLGWVFFQRGEYDQAIIELEKASRIVKGDPVILEHLGDAYRALRRYREALAAYKQSEAISGGNSSILEKIESTEKGLE